GRPMSKPTEPTMDTEEKCPQVLRRSLERPARFWDDTAVDPMTGYPSSSFWAASIGGSAMAKKLTSKKATKSKATKARTTPAQTVTLEETLRQLESLSNAAVHAQNAKRGAGDNQFGVKLGDIRILANKIK